MPQYVLHEERAGNLIGVTASSMERWMRRMGLPGHGHVGQFRKVVTDAAANGDPIAEQACMKRRWRVPLPVKP